MFKYKDSECPTSSLDQENAASVLGCSPTSQYHCMRDQRGNLGEICVIPSWIPAGYCPEYNTDAVKVDAEKCDKSLGLCPKKTYMSNEVLSYSACLKRIQTTYPQISTDVSMPNTSSSNLFETTQNPSWPEKIVISIIFASVSVCILIAIIVIIIAVRRRRVKSKDKVRTEENSCLLPADDILEFYNGRYFNEQFGACKKAKEFLESKESLLIVGTPGSGKTSLCVYLYNFFQRKLFTEISYHCLFVKEVKYLQSCIRPGVPNLIFLDDCFESWVYMTDQEKSDLDILQRLHFQCNTDRKKQLITVMTMDSSTWDMFKPNVEKLNAFENVLDISNFDNDGQKQKTCEDILKAHGVEIVESKAEDNFGSSGFTVKPKLHKANISEFVNEWNNNNLKRFGFPLTCIIFCINRNLLKKGAEVFSSPYTSIKNEIRRMMWSFDEKDIHHYLTLVYTMLLGTLDICSIDADLKENLETEVMPNLIRKTNATDVSNSSNSKGSLTFYEKSHFLRVTGNNQFAFIHETVLAAILTEFGTWNPSFLLKFCDIKILLKFVRLDEAPFRPSFNRERLLLLTKDFYKHWARRLADTDTKVALAHTTLQSEKLKKEYQIALRTKSNYTESAKLCTPDNAEFVEMNVLESH